MKWRTGLPSKKTDLRAMVEVINGRKKNYLYDVGYKELVEIFNTNEKTRIIDLGKLAPGREYDGTEEQKNVLKFVEENKIPVGRK